MNRLRVGLLVLVACSLLSRPAAAGSSAWIYFAPYESDTNAALQKLRWSVFRKGDFYRRGKKRKVKSPDEAMQMNDEEGTHSIIDIAQVTMVPSDKCEFGHVCPLPPARLKELLGSEHPSRADVERGQLALQKYFDAWSGVYVLVYEGSAPKWICFAGHSGD